MVSTATSEAPPSSTTAATSSSSSCCAEWSALPRWMREALGGNPLRYQDFLPVQAAVIPYVLRGIRSCLPMDVCLSAPTGSGKTLCYLVPMLSLIGEEKRELPGDTRLRAVIVVPTKALGTQVHAVLKRLTAGTNISVACACGENPAKEAQQLVRRVKLLGAVDGVADDDDDEDEDDQTISPVADDEDELVHVDINRKNDDEENVSSSSLYPAGKTLYYSAADIVIATPQRLLKHCGTTAGFTLRHLRMLVIDEADQVLAAGANGSGVNASGTSSSSNFTNLIGRLLQLCEPSTGGSATTTSELIAGGGKARRTAVLHKILCSATLSVHITRISEVRLRNVKQFSLATDGTALEDVDAKVVQDATGPLSHFTSRFALPPKLHEHMLTTTDERRPALLLKLIQHILSNGATSAAAAALAAAAAAEVAATAAKESAETTAGSEETPGGTPKPSSTKKRHHDDEPPALPAPVGEQVGKTCVVFCAQSDTARVLAKFLARCDVPALDFTSTSSVAERRQFVISGVSGKAVVLITTDALMRGVDLPGVGHVVMYDAPQSLPQFVHRVGRTARALREGHAYLLLSKKGPSGTLADGEVAQFRALDKYITRSIPVVYEKGLQILTDADVESAAVKLQETRQTLESLLLSTASAPSANVADKKKTTVVTKPKRAREE
ncbi:ATP-dependent RNA helicase, putative [Bodo saltans]|uniref:ATP-dependent RNA helicase n=1 Tax=Bodo saltans TaxID=75058 RepID=A0A0S4JIC9_BODSA|nr:ATP-dependent RNA helicase, putative [Bodo saltans]|eukprot:CUG90067.1 ATP-dependent RNA helicase, putative [Bodo saltans]